MNGSVRVVAVALVVVLAGCAAPVADFQDTGQDDTVGEYEDPTLTVEGELPVDANRTLERVETLLEVDIYPPTVYVEEPFRTSGPIGQDESSFYTVMGVGAFDPADVDGQLRVGGVASAMQAVYILPGENATAPEIEQVLVHEFVHTAQYQQNAPQRVLESMPPGHVGTTDGTLALTSLLEGGAVYVSSAYTERYDQPVDSERAVLSELYPNASPGTKLAWGPYYHGDRYVDAAVDSPATHWSVYDEPPVTMAQVLSGEPASASHSGDPISTFDLALETTNTTWQADHGATDVMGEFVLRTVLETELSAATSAEAAAGWQYDQLVPVETPNASATTGYTWAITFENDTTATTFEAATLQYLENRSEVAMVNGESLEAFENSTASDDQNATWLTDEYAFAVDRPDERTIVLFAGTESFVDLEATTATDDGSVSITLEGADTDSGTVQSIAESTIPESTMPEQTTAGSSQFGGGEHGVIAP
ncbi:hypothetical protein OB919_09960 [Halobacteria archaeon AArc-curdl1]|uniref:DUF4157 domain-containing protein n=1 Tax=Natronosalvus hydrolyticus TaxID=2979988 RepID=A0AAP3E6Y7_9EURY|nr:hypothetical protein [Halobacteria archaeon AArc-curdl1]